MLNRFGETWPEMRRKPGGKPGQYPQFPISGALFAGNPVTVPGFARGIRSRVRRVPKTVRPQRTNPVTLSTSHAEEDRHRGG